MKLVVNKKMVICCDAAEANYQQRTSLRPSFVRKYLAVHLLFASSPP